MGSESAQKKREQKRTAETQELMQNIMTGGEISKKREAELAAAADAGRGVQLIMDSPTVGNLKQLRRDEKGNPIIDPVTGKPQYKAVMRTGAKASDYTGRIAASSPTFGEALSDMSRAVFGGQAEDPSYLRGELSSAPGTTTTNYAKFLPEPRKVKGIVPTMIEGGGSPVMMAVNAILGKPNQKKQSVDDIYNQGVTSFAGTTRTLMGNRKSKLGQ